MRSGGPRPTAVEARTAGYHGARSQATGSGRKTVGDHMARLKVGVLISGSGTNLQALIDDCARADAESEIVLVLSNRADAFGLTRAERAGLPRRVIDPPGI